MRLVSLCPSTTETLIDLGLADSLVGITRFCIHPADAVAAIPKMGGTKDPDLVAIRAARPDLVLMNAEENRIEDHQALARDLRVEVQTPKTVGEVPDLIRRLGDLTDRRPRAELRASEIESALWTLDLRVSRRFRFAYLIWRKPWMGVGADTYVDDLFRRAGGDNVLATGGSRYPEVTLTALAALAPERIFLPDEPFPFGESHRVEVSRAVPEARIALVSGDDCCWHGVRTLRGIGAMIALADACAQDA